jgi:hypothetical protein
MYANTILKLLNIPKGLIDCDVLLKPSIIGNIFIGFIGLENNRGTRHSPTPILLILGF